MKTNDIPRVQYKISTANFENVLDVFTDTDGQYFYNLLKTLNVPEDLDPDYYDIHIVKYGDMWPTIAYKYYGNVVLWWLVCATNQIQDPSTNPLVGSSIKIIKPHYVTKILSDLA